MVHFHVYFYCLFQRKVSAPARYGTLDRHTYQPESITRHSESVTQSQQTETLPRHTSSYTSNDATTRYTTSQSARDTVNSYSTSHNTSESSNRYNSLNSTTTTHHIAAQSDELSNKLPCEFCSEPQEMEKLMKHQVTKLLNSFLNCL
jgi:hypothetical protein